MNEYRLIADDNDGILDILKTYVAKEGFSPIIGHIKTIWSIGNKFEVRHD